MTGIVPRADDSDTPVARLARIAAATPDRPAFCFVRDGTIVTAAIDYGELDRQAGQVAAALSERAATGDRILIPLKPGPAFPIALFGCWRAGMVPVPAYPPRANRPHDRALSIARDAGATLALVHDEPRADTRRALADGGIDSLDIGSLTKGEAPAPFNWPADALHLLQYTSGSTSEPKGVRISAAALAANLAALNDRVHDVAEGVTVSWLPHFHDFGLVEGVIQTIWRGDTAYLMSPTEFVKRPILWLKAMSHFRATETQAPNFAFDLINRSVAPADLDGLDLSSIRNVIIGAEPIRKASMDAFIGLVAPAGFDPAALHYGYGMAETTLAASIQPGPPAYRAVDAAALDRGAAMPVDKGQPSREIACCGAALIGFDLAIVDPETSERLPHDRVGEVWLAGPSLASGYWERAAVNVETFGAMTIDGTGPYLRTGDLGFADGDGRLFITGRLKDLIIVHGRNLYPQDIEATARDTDARLAEGRGAAFALESDARERVVLVHEVRRDGAPLDGVIEAVRRAVADEHGVELDAIALVRSGTLPVTSSGKIQRRAARQAWLDGALVTLAEWCRGDAREAPVPPVDGMMQQLIGFAAKLSGLPPESIDPSEPLSHLGLGSLEATQFIGEIEAAFGLEIDPTVPYTHPTIAQVAQLVLERSRQVADDAVRIALGSLSGVAEMVIGEPEPLPDDAIAIVGMACRFPGAPDLDSFWDVIEGGRRTTGPIPAGRGDLEATFAGLGAEVPRHGGFLDRVDGFDPGFFKMAPAEAALLDPQHRLLLEVAWEALETLADAPDHWAGKKVGVFAGISQLDYFMLLARTGQLAAAHAPTGNAHNMAANRLSYLLDLKGPSLAVDTACSSSLVALATAVRSIASGDCDMAIVAGVNLTLDGQLTAAFAHANMLAPDGACKSFDVTANGYGRGEGCGVVILKRAAAAHAAGDRIWAQVAGAAVNQDGLSNGLTAPNGTAQEAVIRAALANAGIDGREIAYVEAHGSGTPLGDPVEANALAAALGDPASQRAIGTVKSNIGHLEAAAGIAGLIKAVLVLDRRTVPPLAGFTQPNPLIANAARRFDLPREATPLADDARYVGVSSFGFGGTNAHVVLRSVAAAIPLRDDAPLAPVALCLSARDAPGLRGVASRWRDALRADPVSAASVWAANALRRRAALRHRLAVIGGSAGELADQLDRWLAGETQPLGDRHAPEEMIASAWLAGERPDWRALWGGAPLPLLDLPSYPFQRQRCWATDGTAAPIVVATPGPTVAVPDGALEDRLTAIIGRLLGLDPVALDRHERFIEMGADSIVLASAVREVEQLFGTTIELRQILEDTPTIATLARHLAECATRAAPVVPILPHPPIVASASIETVLAESELTMATLIAQQQQLRTLVAGAAPGGVDIPAALVGTRAPPVASVWTDRATRAAEPVSRSLDAVAARYLPRTSGSKRLAAEARGGLADARASAGFRGSNKELLYPIAADRASGARMTDVDGNDYVDLTMGFGVLLFGHAPDFVTQAMSAEIARGMPIGPQNRLAGEVAALLRKLTGTERVCFASTGTEAVMTALRLARAVTGRRKVVVFEGAYHGHADGVLGVARESGTRLETVPLAPGIAAGAVADLVVLPYADARSIEIIRSLGDQIAAIMVEPVQSRRPDLQPGDFLHALRSLCDANGAALVFDEMITGFRIAPGGAQEHFGVRADLITYGKILGGGMPIGAIAGARRFLDALDGGTWNYGDDSGPHVPTTFFAGTFNKHPLAMAGARAVLGRIIAEGPALYERLNQTAAALEARLTPVLARADIRIARFGSMFRFRHHGNADAFFYGLLDRGLYLWEGKTCFLSTEHGPIEIEAIVAAVTATVDELTGEMPVTIVAGPPPSSGAGQLLLLADLVPGAWLAYHEAAAVRLGKGVTAARVEAALKQLAARHAVLAGDALPLVRQSCADAGLADTLTEGRAVPLDRAGPPWRAVLIETDAAPVLMLVVHHAAIDGLSLGLLLDEAVRLIAGETLAAVVTARVATPRPARAENLRWWQDRLAALPPVLSLPTDRPRPATASLAGGSVECAIPAELWMAVQQAAVARHATSYMICAAAWSAALHRITGSDHLVLGIAAAGRDGPDEDALIGNFAQMLPVECRLGARDTLAQHARQVRGALLDTYARQDVDMAAVLEASARPFDPARPAAFPLSFNLDRSSSDTVVSVPTTHAKFELALNLLQAGDAVTARIDFATDLFDAATASAWLDGFVVLLDGLCRTPERRPADIWASQPLVAAPEPLPHPTLPDWLSDRAAAHPGAIAIEFGSELFSYRALAERAAGIAAAITARVSGSGQRIAIALTPSPDLPAALWGVQAAGHGYLPIDARHPPARLRRILAEAGAVLILTDEAHRAALDALGLALLVVEDVADAPAPAPPVPALAPDSLAYVLHSSGSTGEPKGIAVSHGALVNLLASMAEAPGAGAGDRLLALTPLTFDIAALELFLPLVTGGTLVVAPEAIRGDGPALARLIAETRATIVQATPSVWSLITATGWQSAPGLKMLCGGEALPATLAARLSAGGGELWNMYGPTETTIWSTCGRVLPGAQVDLGDPVRGTLLTVLDSLGGAVAPGAIGELAIGGVGLARGYWGRPDLTAERFRPGADGSRLYLTGDLVRQDAAGRLHFLGRRDDQVKVAGQRIELGEIAAALEALPGVARAVVLVEAAGSAGRLIAYVQPVAGSAPSATQLRDGLAATLPPHLVPARLILTDTLPVTANGKIDRKALAAFDRAAPITLAPLAGAEARIAGIWQSVLGLERIDPDASFFALGGTSLMLAHMHVQVSRELVRDFPLVDCVHYPTIRALARHLGAGDAAPVARALSPAIARGRARAEQMRRISAARITTETGVDHA